MHSKLLAFYFKHTTDVVLFSQMMFAFLQGPRSNFVQVRIHQISLRIGAIIKQLAAFFVMLSAGHAAMLPRHQGVYRRSSFGKTAAACLSHSILEWNACT
jgi:hypothetical protein